MTYDENLSLRMREMLANVSGLEEKKMFGGVGFLVNGNMACGVHKDSLIVRVGPEKYQAALDKAHARVFDMTGRPMTGWVMVAAPGFASDKNLADWVQQGLEYTLSLPPK
ncbi:MAG: RNA methyltransferase [Chloroflexi bacterium GWB2_49_20]|nr:MAG: RNA methyltransferase [Chloroflexi bacterium GWB2_49_20]OGN77532.1 MAG: RNA methyltransferase [Chloroflexi bacterium GWC2_49_37]OGN83205.1 MAG: RNA methyltransferase [Chloroflexi bacterium GWD2_49_16]